MLSVCVGRRLIRCVREGGSERWRGAQGEEGDSEGVYDVVLRCRCVFVSR